MMVLFVVLIILLLMGISGVCYVVYVHYLIKNSEDWMDNSEYDYGHDVKYDSKED